MDKKEDPFFGEKIAFYTDGGIGFYIDSTQVKTRTNKIKMKNALLTLTLVGFSNSIWADDGHLRAIGIGNLVVLILPIVVILLLVFLFAVVARFSNPEKISSRVLRVSGWITVAIVALFWSALGAGPAWEFHAISGGVVIICAVVLFLDNKMKISQ